MVVSETFWGKVTRLGGNIGPIRVVFRGCFQIMIKKVREASAGYFLRGLRRIFDCLGAFDGGIVRIVRELLVEMVVGVGGSFVASPTTVQG